MAILHAFLRENTRLTLEMRDDWLLATHWEGDGLPAIGFRADMDAIPDAGGARHGCGHDGHSAILCALALEMEGKRLGKNIHLIFQGAEETGEGAKHICDTWPELSDLNRIYGLHNIPGYPRGTLLLRRGCFACASEGVVIDVHGKPAHAASPGDGANPAHLLCRAVLALPGMVEKVLKGGDRLLMATVIGVKAGGENFGMAASDGRLCLTLRGHRQADIDALADQLRRFIDAGCADQGMAARYAVRDAFPDTTNPPEIADEAMTKWTAAGCAVTTLDQPMRWSEDFGWYLRQTPGLFFGVGIGVAHPGLHTAEYCFDDAIIEPAVRAFAALI